MATPTASAPLLPRLLTVPVVVAVFLVGLWFLAGRVADDMNQAKAVIGTWFVLVGAVALYIAVRSRSFALPVLGTYVVMAIVVGGYLGYTTLVDKTVNEQVAVAGAATGNTLLGRAQFVKVEHPTSGTAAVIEMRDGGRVVTLIDFETDPGPDLRVRLLPGNGTNADDNVDLGGLKGNEGNQQYEIPANTDLEKYTAVVIWCRAFSVAFGKAVLERSS
jgi:uncharacterized membrane protein YdcZ (DUF606 family)